MTEQYEFGPFRLDCGTRVLWRGAEPVALTPKAFDFLRALVTSGGHVLEKDALMKLVWPDSFVGEDSLTQNIAMLRRALGDTPEKQEYIVTVPRHGYRFGAPVRAVAGPNMAEQRSACPIDLRLTPAAPVARALVIVATLVLVCIGLAVSYVRRTAHSTPAVYGFVVMPPVGTSFSSSASFLAVSPDGRWLAFLASRPGEESRLWVRALESPTARELTGTEGALGPFWSPDSRFLAFFAKGTLKKVGMLGEAPETLCGAPSIGVLSGTWHRNGVILFTHAGGIYRTTSGGGAATPVTSVDTQRGESAHVLPQFLPDGRRFLYTARVSSQGAFESWIVSRSLDAADDRRLFAARSQALFAGDDYLLFLREGGLVAQPFDRARLQPSADPLPVPGAEHVAFNPASPRGMFSASQNGIVAYRTRTLPELAWFDRSGTPLGSIGVAGDGNPALSHDGRRVAISRYDPMTATRSLWLLDVSQGGVASRLTSRTTWDMCPVWSFDDKKIVFVRGAPNQGQLHEMSATGTAQERVVPLRAKGCPGDWSRDGRYLLYGVNADGGSPGGLWVLPAGEHADPVSLDGTSPFGPRGPRGRISPNGRWLAYEAEASGRREIYVRSFPDGAGGSWPISSEGGNRTAMAGRRSRTVLSRSRQENDGCAGDNRRCVSRGNADGVVLNGAGSSRLAYHRS